MFKLVAGIYLSKYCRSQIMQKPNTNYSIPNLWRTIPQIKSQTQVI